MINESIVKISKLDFDGILIPETQIDKGQLYRIELGVSHRSKIDLLRGILEEECSVQHVTTTRALKENNRIETLIFSKTVEDYLSNNNISLEKIESLIKTYNLNSFKEITKGTKLKHLSEPELRLVKIFALIQNNKKIFIDTSGMYLSILIDTYELIKTFLKEGGIVIEFTYPHFGKSSELQWYASKKIKTIKIGNMRI